MKKVTIRWNRSNNVLELNKLVTRANKIVKKVYWDK